MPRVAPKDPVARRAKELVDMTYKLPLKKITTSRWLKNLIETAFAERVHGLVPIGNNFETFHSEDLEQVTRKRGKRVLLAYRPQKWKGGPDGMLALKIVKERFPDVELLAYGAQRHGCIPDWVQFYEGVSDEELRSLYCSCDIFVLPSWVEGWGSPPMEAMACGAACVVTDVGAVPDYAVPGKTALVVPPRSPGKLAAGIIDLLEDDERRLQIAKAGHEFIQKFTWDRSADQFEAVLHEILAQDGD